jgi:hypothetical protein
MPIQSVGVSCRRFFLFLILLPLLPLSAASQEVGTLTLLKDSPLRVIRGCSVLMGVEGMKLRQGDILEAGPAGTSQTQLEFAGGAVVELGPSTRVFLFSQSGSAAELVLVNGWLKGETTSGSYRYATPLVTATTKGGNVLVHAAADATDVFVERGSASVGAGSSGVIPSSTSKIFFTRRGGKPVTAAGRPSQDFISGMPVSFRDLLPSRLDRFKGKKPPVLKSDHEVSYAEVERWFALSPGWRRGFVERFKPRLEDSSFRQSIEDHLAALPEWDPILHPENHKTTEPAPTDKSDSPPGRYLR